MGKTRTNMKRNILYCFILLFLGLGAQAQTQKAWEAAADKAFDFKDYYSAMVYYQNALEFTPERTDLIFKCAESARQFNAYKLAAKYYKQVLDKEKNGGYPTVSFWLAEMNFHIGKYPEAKTFYELYLSENEGDDAELTEKAKLAIKSIEFAIPESKVEFEDVDLTHLGGQINTPYSDFSPYLKGDSLYYSSLRFENKADTYKPRRPISKVLISREEGAGVPIENGFNMDQLHTAHSAFNTEGNKIYYTICEYLNGKDIRCDLYVRDVNPDGTFGNSMKLPEPVNNAAFTTTQPNVGKDKESGNEVLYFVSNRSEGKGGYDIWYSSINSDGTYGTPVNFSAVNTMMDEITPFYHSSTGVFYFSTNGRVGLGGYDIYSTELRNGSWLDPENLSIPVNSSYNDLYYMIIEDNKKAYFASNRQGGIYMDESSEACCNDIYRADYLDIDLNLLATTFDKLTREKLNGATVTLVDLSDPDNPRGITNLEGNEFNFELDRAKDYVVTAVKEGYFPDSVNFTTKRIRKSETIKKELFLRTTRLDLEINTFDKRNNLALNGATIKIIDKSDPSDELIVQMDDETNQIVLPVERGKEFLVIASKRGYSPDTATVITRGIDDQNRIVKNMYLGLGNLEDLLPLALFFDNDEPDKRTYKTRTSLRYEETFPPYYARKDEFINVWSNPLTGVEKTQAADEVRRFFDKEVKQGNEHLRTFIALLEKALIDENQKVEIVLQGFASPRASAAYNEALSKRRISSVLNQITKYSDGKLNTFITNKKLVISERAYGSRRAPKYVSGNLKDTRNSIYSIPASRERRVEIIQVTRNKSNRR